MPIYNAPLREMKFVMQEMLDVGDLTKYERFAEADTDTLDAILDAIFIQYGLCHVSGPDQRRSESHSNWRL